MKFQASRFSASGRKCPSSPTEVEHAAHASPCMFSRLERDVSGVWLLGLRHPLSTPCDFPCGARAGPLAKEGRNAHRAHRHTLPLFPATTPPPAVSSRARPQRLGCPAARAFGVAACFCFRKRCVRVYTCICVSSTCLMSCDHEYTWRLRGSKLQSVGWRFDRVFVR